MNSRARMIGAGAAAVVLIGLTSACSTDGGTGDEKSITVAVLDAPGFQDCVADVTPTFTDETGIKVELVAIPYPSMLDKYNTAFNSGTGSYDLIQLAFQWTGQFADGGYISPVSPIDSKVWDGMLPSAVKQYEFDGEQYGIPFTASVYGYYYRTDIMEELGLEYPTSVAEAQELMETLAGASEVADSGLYPIAMESVNKGMANFNSFYRSLGGSELQNAAGEPQPIDVAIAEDALEAIRDNIETFAPPGAVQANGAAATAQFRNGETVTALQFADSFGNQLISDESKVKGNYTFRPFPGGHGDLGGWGYAVTSDASDAEAAQQFAEFLARSDIDLICATGNGKLPVQSAGYSEPSVAETIPYLSEVEGAIDSGVQRYSGPQASTLIDIMNTVVANYLADQYSDTGAAAQDLADQIAAVR